MFGSFRRHREEGNAVVDKIMERGWYVLGGLVTVMLSPFDYWPDPFWWLW